LLTEGATAFTLNKYEEALLKYKAVIGLDAENTIAKTKTHSRGHETLRTYTHCEICFSFSFKLKFR
jgi:hypothetical protein